MTSLSDYRLGVSNRNVAMIYKKSMTTLQNDFFYMVKSSVYIIIKTTVMIC